MKYYAPYGALLKINTVIMDYVLKATPPGTNLSDWVRIWVLTSNLDIPSESPVQITFAEYGPVFTIPRWIVTDENNIEDGK